VNRTVRPEVPVAPLRPLFQADLTALQAFFPVPAAVDRVPAAMGTLRTVHRRTLRAIHKVSNIRARHKVGGSIKQNLIPLLPAIHRATCPVMLMKTHLETRSTVTTTLTKTITVDHEIF
jgi:hypothetical protein